MLLIGIGALLVIGGIVLMTTSTLKRGRMSQSEQPITHQQRDTLEPIGRGRRLGLKADVPGMAMILLGAILLFAGAA